VAAGEFPINQERVRRLIVLIMVNPLSTVVVKTKIIKTNWKQPLTFISKKDNSVFLCEPALSLWG